MPPRTRYQPLSSADPLLTTNEVAWRLRCSTRTVWRYVAQGLLPEPIRLSPQKCLWRESAIQLFLQSRAPGRRQSAS
jgi:predicted DNA-binding transcriptional regulator AlpA